MSETPVTQVTTHVLDLVTGFPAPQVNVRLADMQGVELCTASTNSDGRIEHWGSDVRLTVGTYRMTFDVAGYRRSLNGQEEPAFFPQIDIVFHLRGDRERVHIPVLLSAYGYTTYRGS